MNNNLPTDYSKIYDYFYKKFADQVFYSIKNPTKSKVIDNIFRNMSWDDQEVIRARVKYASLSYDKIVKMTGIPKVKLTKKMDNATRHMYSPQNISIAVPRYYKIKSKNQHKITEADFGGNKYITNRLIEAGLDTREKLLRHLHNGWYFLWTIPGCGDNSRQKILLAIDRWTAENIIKSRDELRELKRTAKKK